MIYTEILLDGCCRRRFLDGRTPPQPEDQVQVASRMWKIVERLALAFISECLSEPILTRRHQSARPSGGGGGCIGCPRSYSVYLSYVSGFIVNLRDFSFTARLRGRVLSCVIGLYIFNFSIIGISDRLFIQSLRKDPIDMIVLSFFFFFSFQ